MKAAQDLANPTALAALDLCSERPDEWVPFEEVIAASGREPAQARGDTGGRTFQIRKYFGRSNWPYEAQWAAGGTQQAYYRMTGSQAAMWKAARSSAADGPSAAQLGTASPAPTGPTTPTP